MLIIKFFLFFIDLIAHVEQNNKDISSFSIVFGADLFRLNWTFPINTLSDHEWENCAVLAYTVIACPPHLCYKTKL